MKKGVTITLLVIAGLVAFAGLAIGAILELLEAIIGLVVWTVIILIGYFVVKAKTNS